MASQSYGTTEDIISGQQVVARPEEVEAVQPFAEELITIYEYPRESVRTHPQWLMQRSPSDEKGTYPADIVVFKDQRHKRGGEYIVVECKRKNRKDGKKQLEKYLGLSSARLGVWYNGQERLFLLKIHKESGPVYAEIPNIPRYQQRIEDIGEFQRKDLKPSTRLKTVFSLIRNYWAANAVGMTRDEALSQQLINLVFCKIYDERFTMREDIVTFRIGVGEDKGQVRRRIDQLFESVKAQYREVFDANDTIELDDNSLAYFVGEIQPYALTESPRDAVADAFEAFISSALKGPQGQFFTPRNVVNLAIAMTDPEPGERIIDPACGTGGFLIEVLRHFWMKIEEQGQKLNWPQEEISREKDHAAMRDIKGIDKDQFLAKVAKAYMAITGDGRGGIFCENSLEAPSQWQAETRQSVQPESFSVVVTNPPFGKKLTIDQTEILTQYQLGHQWKRDKKSGRFQRNELIKPKQAPQILFVEKCIELLKPGGRMGVVLPESMLSNPSHRYIVQFIESVARIRAVISMPEELFQPYTHAKTLVAIIEKKTSEERVNDTQGDGHDIFMARALWCGHDSRGLEIEKDDIPAIIERFKRYSEGEELEYDHLGFVINRSQIVDSIYLPKYYNPEIGRQLDNLKSTHNLLRLGDLVDAEALEVKTGHEVGKISYRTGNIPFIRTSDIANWEIKADPKHGLSQDIYEEYRKAQDIQENDILMVRDGTYLVGTCAMITKLDTKVVYQSHIFKIRSKDHERINPYLLLAILSSTTVQNQIFAKRFTQDIIDTLGERLFELVLPIPKDKSIRSRVINKVKQMMETKVAVREQMSEIIFSVAPSEDVDPGSEYAFFLRNTS